MKKEDFTTGLLGETTVSKKAVKTAFFHTRKRMEFIKTLDFKSQLTLKLYSGPQQSGKGFYLVPETYVPNPLQNISNVKLIFPSL